MTSTQYTFPYDVVMTTGGISINDASTTNPVVFLPSTGVVHVSIHNQIVRVYGLANGDAALTSATMTQDNYANSNSQISATPVGRWKVRVHMNDNSFFDIPMGKVNNQGSWVNTRAGALVAAKAIDTAVWP